MDFASKKEYIQRLGSEVDQIHPLLESFLHKLDGIEAVEYTHGVNEKGADFILTRQDRALGSTYYVGVIVKRGKIGSDLSDIDKQLEECSLERFICGGKQKISISEVWVITNSTISINAKEKINHKYRNHKIEFIDGEKLTYWVDQFADYFWHQIPSPIGDFLNGQNSRIAALESDAAMIGGINCSEIHIDPDIQEVESHKRNIRYPRRSKARTVNFFSEILAHKISVLEGEMGFGKSRMARKLIRFFGTSQKFNETRVIPIFAPYRTVYESDLDLIDWVKINLAPIEKSLEDCDYKVLVVLDGVDETADNDKWKVAFRNAIDSAKASPRIHLVLTTRPLRILDEEVDLYRGIKRFLLRPLTVAKVIKFIEQACQTVDIPRKIYEDLQKSELFRQLPQSPIAAALLSGLITQNRHDLPSNLTELYSKSIEYMLGRWDVQKGTAPEKEFLNSEQIAMRIAEFMLDNKLIWISSAEAKEIARNWHEKRNIGVPLEALLARIFEKSGIFSIDPDNGTISFRHRSFGEYLYAKYSRHRGKIVLPENAFNPYWVQCTFFNIGLQGDCFDILESLFSTVPRSEGERWLKILAMPEYVLAGYQTEYSLVENHLHTLFLDAAALYQSIRRGETKTQLSSLAEMHLLWLFQRLIRNYFGYEFLRKAITATLLNIENSSCELDNRSIALFFAACYADELSDASGFEFLIKERTIERLPLSIALAIELETKEKKEYSKLPLIKAHEKRLATMLKGPRKGRAGGEQRTINQHISALFEKPMVRMR